MSLSPNSPHARDAKSVIHPYTNLAKHEQNGPLILEEGDGIYVTDTEGKKYIEGLAGLWCTSLGFNNERLVEAATKQMRKLPYYHAFFSRSNLPAIDLAEKLLEIMPVPMARVWFANSGSEANDHMVKFVWYYNNALGRPEKKKIISRLGGYHGIAVSSGSLTGMPLMHQGFDLPIANILHTGNPHYYRHGLDGESEEDFATRRAAELEQMILAEGPETVAAFIAEPVMGAGGVLIPPKTYFEKVQAVLK
ncbi:MAG: aminotransferase class III-fold pyridoxal phosphate-dependent enzyme, partial [Alphaproteobacteria bacterium]